MGNLKMESYDTDKLNQLKTDLEEYEEIDYLFEFGDYIVVQISTWGGGRSVYRLNILDKNYKEVTGFDLKKYGVYAVCDKYLVLSNGKEIHFYDTNCITKAIHTISIIYVVFNGFSKRYTQILGYNMNKSIISKL